MSSHRMRSAIRKDFHNMAFYLYFPLPYIIIIFSICPLEVFKPQVKIKPHRKLVITECRKRVCPGKGEDPGQTKGQRHPHQGPRVKRCRDG